MPYTLADFKDGGAYNIMARDITTDEVYTAIPEKAIASVASEFRVSTEVALRMLTKVGSFGLTCTSKNTEFWIEPKALKKQ